MNKKGKKIQIGIVGSAGDDDYGGALGASKSMMDDAEEIGYLLAKNGAMIVTGGKSGIMEAGARGAKKAGGYTVGVVKGSRRFTSNKYTDIEVISGMEADGFDEFLLVNMCDALIVIGGGAGTLEEIAIAYRNKKPIVALTPHHGWAKELAGKYLDDRNTVEIKTAKSAKEAVEKIFKLTMKSLRLTANMDHTQFRVSVCVISTERPAEVFAEQKVWRGVSGEIPLLLA